VPSAEPAPDPVRSTLVALLQQLNRAESINEGRAREQTLELDEMERLLSRFWAVEQGHVKVPLALGLLVRNGLVEARVSTGRVPGSNAPTPAVYQITAEGKAFLVDVQKSSDRIP
jgi:DNA-binding PadR family transcriptional regulator